MGYSDRSFHMSKCLECPGSETQDHLGQTDLMLIYQSPELMPLPVLARSNKLSYFDCEHHGSCAHPTIREGLKNCIKESQWV